jgi:hypothetical protein
MDLLGRIPSFSFADIWDAVLHPAAKDIPAWFLLLSLAVLGVSALPEEVREKVRVAMIAAFGLIVSIEFSWPFNWGAMLG